jgi:hypothetical protein
MGKTVCKLRPGDYWRIGEHESWFTDMAAEGLHLKKMGLHFVRFAKGKPKKMRYRVDISPNNEITPEQKQLYADSGWDYVTSYGDFNVFSSPVELNAPELHTDPAEQSYTLKELDKKLAINALVVVLATALMTGMMASIWFLGGTPMLNFVEGIIIQQTVLTIFIVYLAYTSLQAAISIRTLRKNLLEGKAVRHDAPWRSRKRFTSIIAVLYVISVVTVSVMPFVQIAMRGTKTLPTTSTDLPIVSLADVEQKPGLVRQSSYIRDNVDWGNRYTYKWSFLAPVQYESNEQGTVPDIMWKDGSGVYSPSINTSVYKLSLPYLAESLTSDLVKKYGLAYKGGDFLKTDHDDFDVLIIHEVDEFKEVFASKGKAVMYIRYHGYADMKSVIESAAKKINLVAD